MLGATKRFDHSFSDVTVPSGLEENLDLLYGSLFLLSEFPSYSHVIVGGFGVSSEKSWRLHLKLHDWHKNSTSTAMSA
jgi:hypothetical protein